MRSCKKCGTEVEKDDHYCPECGEKIVKETKRITVLTVFKIIGAIIFFIIFINIFKNQPPVAVLLLILFLIWSGILNIILRKLFDAELSSGVKVVITAIIIAISLMSVQQMQTVKVQPERFKPVIEQEDLHHFVNRLNNVIEVKDYNSLEIMVKEGMISPEVFEGIIKLFENVENIRIDLRPQDQRFYGEDAEVMVMAVVRSGNQERMEGVRFFFERTERGWRLSTIRPHLLDIQLKRSFEEEAEYKIEKVSKPVIAVSQEMK